MKEALHAWSEGGRGKRGALAGSGKLTVQRDIMCPPDFGSLKPLKENYNPVEKRSLCSPKEKSIYLWEKDSGGGSGGCVALSLSQGILQNQNSLWQAPFLECRHWLALSVDGPGLFP